MFVGCKLPHGLEINHQGERIVLNGANAGFDVENPWKNDLPPDSPLRASGVGLTQLDGSKADAFKDWHDVTSKGDGPVRAGFIFFTEKAADATKEAQALEGEVNGLDGLDPSKDLPEGITTDTDVKKG